MKVTIVKFIVEKEIRANPHFSMASYLNCPVVDTTGLSTIQIKLMEKAAEAAANVANLAGFSAFMTEKIAVEAAVEAAAAAKAEVEAEVEAAAEAEAQPPRAGAGVPAGGGQC